MYIVQIFFVLKCLFNFLKKGGVLQENKWRHEPEPTPEHPIIRTELAIATAVIVVAVVATIGYIIHKKRK